MAYVRTNWVDDVTPLSSTNMNNIEDTLDGLGNVTHEIATQAEAEAGTSNVKYMTPLRTKEAIGHISIKTGIIADNAIIPQTAGYANYMYIVSISTISNPSLTLVGCSVNQTTRRVDVFGGTTAEQANWYEIAW